MVCFHFLHFVSQATKIFLFANSFEERSYGTGSGVRGSVLMRFELCAGIAQVQRNVTGEERNLTRGYFY